MRDAANTFHPNRDGGKRAGFPIFYRHSVSQETGFANFTFHHKGYYECIARNTTTAKMIKGFNKETILVIINNKFNFNFFYMKKVFFILATALVCMAGAISCSEDDGDVALTGITVAPQTIKLPVGEIQRVIVTIAPADAVVEKFTWTSQDENVATAVGVDGGAGVITITGVGQTTVTVAAGTFSQTINVEGIINSLTVTDEDNKTSGVYPYNGTPIAFDLKAAFVPATAELTPVWTSNAETVTVTPSSDGMTATVTITGEGVATITVEAGGGSGIYAISTSSVFESAVGYWAFNDPANIGKASRGSDLVYTAAQFEVVNGPSDAKKGVRIKREGEWKGIEEIQGFVWNHPITDATKLTNYTVLIDARIPSEPKGDYYLVYDSGSESGAAGVAFRSRDGELTVNQSGNTLIYYGRNGTFTPGEEPWVRLVYTVTEDNSSGKDPEKDWIRTACINGQVDSEDLFYTSQVSGSYPNYKLTAGKPVRFLMASGAGESNHAYNVSTIAVWDRVLTKEEIASLGGVSK
jgi:uncharacterized protein YjdB